MALMNVVIIVLGKEKDRYAEKGAEAVVDTNEKSGKEKNMNNISIVRALPLAAGGSDIAKKAFDELRGPRKSGATDYIKNIVKMTKYYAWLQQGSAGDFLVEYWESPYTWEDIAANAAKAADTPHLQWAHEQIAKMTGVKPETPLDITFKAMSDWPDKGGKTGLASPTGFALPILPGKIGLLKETIGGVSSGEFQKRRRSAPEENANGPLDFQSATYKRKRFLRAVSGAGARPSDVRGHIRQGDRRVRQQNGGEIQGVQRRGLPRGGWMAEIYPAGGIERPYVMERAITGGGIVPGAGSAPRFQ